MFGVILKIGIAPVAVALLPAGSTCTTLVKPAADESVDTSQHLDDRVETDVHHPTDVSLLWAAVRCLLHMP